jgi:hypothetical protein
LSVNEVGLGLLPLQDALKPGVPLTEAPAGIDPLYETLVTVTALPDCEKVPFHPCVIVWPPGKLNFSVQPLIAVVPVLVIERFAPKPPDHCDDTV